MKAVLTGVLLALVLELVLALAFWAGAAWLGGLLPWPWSGVSLAAAAALALLALMAGDLDVAYDSDRQRVDVRCGWIARRQSSDLEDGAGRLTRTRILFVSWTRRRARRSLVSELERVSGWRRSLLARFGESARPLSRAIAAAAPAMHDLIWNSREMTVRVESPTRLAFADRVLAGLIGQRRFGPLDVQFGDGEQRAIRARYRIRLYRAVLVALAMFAEGRPDRAVRALGELPETRHRDAARAARRE